jgi:hypothetical protein
VNENMIKVKILDRNLMKSFGGILVTIEKSKAERLVRSGKATYVDRTNTKAMYGPPDHKAVFHAPEDKTMHEIGSEHRYPDKNDVLFPHIIK